MTHPTKRFTKSLRRSRDNWRNKSSPYRGHFFHFIVFDFLTCRLSILSHSYSDTDLDITDAETSSTLNRDVLVLLLKNCLKLGLTP